MDDWVDIGNPNEVTLPIRSAKPLRSTDVSMKFYAAIEAAALRRLTAAKTPIFHVDLGDEPVYTTFVKNLVPELRQEYACSRCRHFANRYGDLALINDDGDLEPLLWSMADLEGDIEWTTLYLSSVRAIRQRFAGCKVISEFKVVQKHKELGKEEDGGFNHMRLRFPQACVRKEELAGFTSANTTELANMLDRVLADYELGTIRKIYSMLEQHKLPYADNHKASAKWLLDLVEQDKIPKITTPVRRHNLLYRYGASSFTGSLKQLRSGAMGTLLESIKTDCSWDDTLAQWKNVCDPTAYMRPQAAPSAGNIKAAERLFEQLGLTNDDLRRRLLVQDDIPKEVVMWSSENMKTKQKVPKPTGVFSVVKAKDKFTANKIFNDAGPAVSMTFTRFVTKILPSAKSVHCWLGRRDCISTLVTGIAGSKPLMQWHDSEGCNLASHYLWTSPPAVEKHNLKSNDWNEVRCLIPFPWLWDGAPLTTTLPLVDPDGEEGKQYKYYHKHKGFRYMLVLEENHESNLDLLPLFPELLKSEFHPVRSTIEAYSKNGKLEDVADGKAKGGFVAGVEASRGTADHKMKLRVVRYDGGVDIYRITHFE